jgi:tetratricopeptide (TPR) repeat protein
MSGGLRSLGTRLWLLAKRRPLLGISALLGTLVVVAGLAMWAARGHGKPVPPSRQAALPNPPSIELDEADPAVVKLVAAARAAVSSSPSSADAWGRLGMALYAHNFASRADTSFAQAEQLDGGEARWPYFQGLIQTTRDPERAIQKLRRAAELCHDDPDAPRLRLAELLLAQGQLEEAGDQFRRILERDPLHARAHLGLGRLAARRGDLDESQNHLRMSLRDPRAQNASRSLLAEVQARRGEKASAEAIRDVASGQNDPPWPDPYLEESLRLQTGRKVALARASALLGQDRPSEAAELLEQTVRDDPDSDWAWLLLGRAHIRRLDFPAAEKALRKALELAPDSVEAQFRLGVVFYRQRNPRAATPWFRKAVTLKPDFTMAHYDLGFCLIEQGDRPGAIEAFRAAARCQPDMADAHTMLGDLLAQDRKNAEALEHLRLAVQLKPKDQKAQTLLAQVLKQVGAAGSR